MTTRSDLRAALIDLVGADCEWPECPDYGSEMAHLRGIGMGGRRSADTLDNVSWLCHFHHDLLDGRTQMDRRYWTATLLAAYVKRSRPSATL